MLDLSKPVEAAQSPADEFCARAASVLGPRFAVRLGAALNSSPVRFKYRKGPQAAVLAVLELLELLADRVVSPDDMPPRWRDQPAEECAGSELRARLEAVLGPNSLQIVCLALGLTMRTFGELVFDGKRSSPRTRAELAAVVELIEVALATGPAAELPRRWRVALPPSPPGRPVVNGADVEARAIRVLGASAAARLAHAIGRRSDYLQSTFRAEPGNVTGLKLQPGVVALVELLELLQAEGIPPDRWPARFRLTEGGS